MLSKILLALGVVLATSVLGSALKCNVCAYSTTQPKEQQICTGGPLTCRYDHTYCYTTSITFQNGTKAVERSCGTSATCFNTERACNVLTRLFGLKSCAFECCTTYNCNNYTPSSATGVMVTKFTLSLMVIVGFIFA
ncbi:Hypothetical predicted protein [Paramuricea clavata]|uniref:Uncharacterized protein n=1 Tax=Paramuricea clavata TaxID=317549 RepID=A0A6S7GZE8_PARCT|nr:Hypothetical predicted protein [Paramuricea clavata]